jgi:hypothetical protein
MTSLFWPLASGLRPPDIIAYPQHSLPGLQVSALTIPPSGPMGF